VRQVRAPLAAGYLWLLTAWIIIHDKVASEKEAEGALAAVYDVRGAASTVSVAIGASFAAYVVGSLTETLASRVTGLESALSSSAGDSLEEIVARRVREIADLRPNADWWIRHATFGQSVRSYGLGGTEVLQLHAISPNGDGFVVERVARLVGRRGIDAVFGKRGPVEGEMDEQKHKRTQSEPNNP
jgi:hypothetical protein